MTFAITWFSAFEIVAGELARPKPTDLWAFWLLAGLWMGILSSAWVLYRWLRKDDEGTRGL
ncbi:hypothetical protein ACNOYE_23640 [Nannocystaceae bacterium ST9]